MELRKLYPTACGGKLVPFDNAAEYFAAHPEAVALLDEAIAKIVLPTDGSRLEISIDLGRPLGPAGCVEVADIGLDGAGLFAQRPKRPGKSRVVVLPDDEVPTVSTFVVVGKPMRNPGEYRLITAYIGTQAPAEPWGGKTAEDRARLLEFWRTHALVWNDTMAQAEPGTWRQAMDAVPLDVGGPHD